jgi:S-adenosylmethionine:tRNA ribosyltransferase-isomerase
MQPMLTSEYDYDLPRELIAQEPIEPRDASRLLVIHRDDARLEHRSFREIGEYLRAGDVLVVNETRVIPARIRARKEPTGGHVELLLLRKCDDVSWEALVKGRHARPGQRLALLGSEDAGATIEAVTAAGGRVVRFDAPIEGLLERIGTTPLPPYITRPLADPERYQTVYARQAGSVAAPTAGLHFTRGLIDELTAMGIIWARVLLHIGLDTFRPVSEERIEDHRMHTEWCSLGVDAADAVRLARSDGRRVIAVGTTAVRVLETAARRHDGNVRPWSGATDLYITPGYAFRVVDALITNFHLPRSTLLMLVSALAGRDLVRRAYAEAIGRRYRFYSLGDATLIL